MLDNFDEHIGMWNNVKNRQCAIDSLVTFGTDLVIGANGEDFSFDLQMPKEAAIAKSSRIMMVNARISLSRH